MPNYGPGSPGFIRSATDAGDPQLSGDIVVYAGTNTTTVKTVTGNTTQSSFISTNVDCAASVQTVIASVTLNPGKWDIWGTVAASVNVGYKIGDSEIAVLSHGSSASAAYGGTALAADLAQTEATGTVATFVDLSAQTSPTTVDLVGKNVAAGGPGSRFTALAATTSGYTNATGIVATPVV